MTRSPSLTQEAHGALTLLQQGEQEATEPAISTPPWSTEPEMKANMRDTFSLMHALCSPVDPGGWGQNQRMRRGRLFLKLWAFRHDNSPFGREAGMRVWGQGRL